MQNNQNKQEKKYWSQLTPNEKKICLFTFLVDEKLHLKGEIRSPYLRNFYQSFNKSIDEQLLDKYRLELTLIAIFLRKDEKSYILNLLKYRHTTVGEICRLIPDILNESKKRMHFIRRKPLAMPKEEDPKPDLKKDKEK